MQEPIVNVNFWTIYFRILPLWGLNETKKNQMIQCSTFNQIDLVTYLNHHGLDVAVANWTFEMLYFCWVSSSYRSSHFINKSWLNFLWTWNENTNSFMKIAITSFFYYIQFLSNITESSFLLIFLIALRIYSVCP